jgi:large repetitive protein
MKPTTWLRSSALQTALISVSALLLTLSEAPAQNQPEASWTVTGSMATDRYNHTATLLPSGKVLVTGGISLHVAGNILRSAELYDPATGTWTATGDMTIERADHTATLLPSGKVLVAGGGTFNFDWSSAELYDPATGIWTATDSLATPRLSHTATLLPSGKVLVAGGLHAPNELGSAELYDPATGTWTATGNLSVARYGQTATLLGSGKVLVAGGWTYFIARVLNSPELYDPATGTWTSTGSMHIGRTEIYNTATLLPSGVVLIEGGLGNGDHGTLNRAELYDPLTGRWTETGKLSHNRYDHSATLLPSGKVLVAGGFKGGRGGLRSAELYDPSAGSWTVTAHLANGRESHTATLLPSGKVLVAGGIDGDSLSSAELYDDGE